MASTFLLFKKQEFKIYASLELAYSTLLKSMSGKKIIRLTLTPNKRKSSKKDTGEAHRRGAQEGGAKWSPNNWVITREENLLESY